MEYIEKTVEFVGCRDLVCKMCIIEYVTSHIGSGDVTAIGCPYKNPFNY